MLIQWGLIFFFLTKHPKKSGDLILSFNHRMKIRLTNLTKDRQMDRWIDGMGRLRKQEKGIMEAREKMYSYRSAIVPRDLLNRSQIIHKPYIQKLWQLS